MVNLGPTESYAPNPGDIGLTTISGWGGKGIQAAQKLMGCPWKAQQHAFVYIGVVAASGTRTIVEAMPGGAELNQMWHPVAHTFYLRCPDEFRDEVAAAALALKGIPYSWLDYQAIALHHLHVPTPHLKSYIESTGHQICSQLADYAALKGGWHLFDDGRWPGYVPPCDLNRLYDKQVYA
jgi:hypothetical protein